MRVRLILFFSKTSSTPLSLPGLSLVENHMLVMVGVSAGLLFFDIATKRVIFCVLDGTESRRILKPCRRAAAKLHKARVRGSCAASSAACEVLVTSTLSAEGLFSLIQRTAWIRGIGWEYIFVAVVIFVFAPLVAAQSTTGRSISRMILTLGSVSLRRTNSVRTSLTQPPETFSSGTTPMSIFPCFISSKTSLV